MTELFNNIGGSGLSSTQPAACCQSARRAELRQRHRAFTSARRCFHQFPPARDRRAAAEQELWPGSESEGGPGCRGGRSESEAMTHIRSDTNWIPPKEGVNHRRRSDSDDDASASGFYFPAGSPHPTGRHLPLLPTSAPASQTATVSHAHQTQKS